MGIIRRDLNEIIQQGCKHRPGIDDPCNCKVCEIMKGITVSYTRSEYRIVPELRDRIRINPYSGTVEEEALFSSISPD